MFTDLRSLDLAGKKVLVRCDFNVPMENGAIADPGRIDASLETIRYILQQGGTAVLCSHLGRPKERDLKYTLKPVAEYLSEKLGMKVALAPDCIGDITGRMLNALGAGQAILSRTCAFIMKRKPTTVTSLTSWPAASMFTSTTPLAPRIVRTPRPRVSPAISASARLGS